MVGRTVSRGTNYLYELVGILVMVGEHVYVYAMVGINDNLEKRRSDKR